MLRTTLSFEWNHRLDRGALGYNAFIFIPVFVGFMKNPVHDKSFCWDTLSSEEALRVDHTVENQEQRCFRAINLKCVSPKLVSLNVIMGP